MFSMEEAAFPEEEEAVASFVAPDADSGGRRLCSGRCGRPTTVCICLALPPEPLHTATQLLVLHHPNELRQRLSTAPILPLCLRRCQTVVGRRLRPGSSTLLDSLSASPPSPSPRAIYLFPSIPPHFPSTHLLDFVNSPQGKSERNKGVVLIVFDGTWNHAREMVRASRDFLGAFAVQVSLGFDAAVEGGSIFDDELVLKKEPFGGCVSTIEAVARALSMLEPNGAEIEERLLRVLRTMVGIQAGYQVKPIMPRPRLQKRGKRNTRSPPQ